jgi:phosphoribosylanthranilate isomerase
VFVDASADEILRAVLECGLHGVQLHGGLNAGLAENLRRRFLAAHVELTKIVCVLSFDQTLPQQLEVAARHGDAVLVDSRSATRAGGTGLCWDWAAGSAAFRGAAGKVRVIAAGGLNPTNVEEAIETLTPWGVDVVTGVEAQPGRKDWRRVEAFIAAAKGARLATEQVLVQ